MREFAGKTLSWKLAGPAVELELHRPPCNEIGTATLGELEQFVAALESLRDEAQALIVYSSLPAGFCAGADLRELYGGMQELSAVSQRVAGVQHLGQLLRLVAQLLRVAQPHAEALPALDGASDRHAPDGGADDHLDGADV